MKIAKYKHYIKNKEKALNKESLVVANALFAELMNYGIILSDELIERISKFKKSKALKLCGEIAKEYTVGALNPPLFKNWEERTVFSFNEFVVQIFGYIFQISGNDLQDVNFTNKLKAKVDFKKFKTLELASDEEVQEYVNNLFGASVSQDRATSLKLEKAAKMLDLKFFNNIKSDEARIAVLLHNSKKNALSSMLQGLSCKPTDVLRFAAAKKDFELVKLPHDVRYANLTWSERVQLLGFLEKFGFDYLNEAMAMNRQAWGKFFHHIHFTSQKGFVNRFNNTFISQFVSSGNKLESAPKSISKKLHALLDEKVIEKTAGGALAYRTFESRIKSAIENKDLDSIIKLGTQRPGYVLRNISTVSNGVTKQNKNKFVTFVREILSKASVDVMFSILQIDVKAEYRIIDIKGDTVVEKANYNPLIADIQGDIERELHRRFGFEGKVNVQKALANNIVPFLAKNTNLARGSKVKIKNNPYLYMFMHWVQGDLRTDLDHSYICFDADWKTDVVYFGQQANSYIAQSGDITNAPAPNGATEYGRININKIPKKIKYIAPAINVYTGNAFSENKEAYAGFFTSDSDEFALSRKHNRYDLNQPAEFNIPFIFDVDNKEIIILDLNSRQRASASVHGYIENIKMAIKATQTKNYVSIKKLAKILSGDKDEVSLTITNKAVYDNEITPDSLFSLFSEKQLA